jgi:hypothetical protein
MACFALFCDLPIHNILAEELVKKLLILRGAGLVCSVLCDSHSDLSIFSLMPHLFNTAAASLFLLWQ